MKGVEWVVYLGRLVATTRRVSHGLAASAFISEHMLENA
jgi:hypothetical protein